MLKAPNEVLKILLQEYFRTNYPTRDRQKILENKSADSRKTPSSPPIFSDDLAQNLFQKNAAYAQSYASEVSAFYDAAAENRIAEQSLLLEKAFDFV
jgi:hypothetical protein